MDRKHLSTDHSLKRYWTLDVGRTLYQISIIIIIYYLLIIFIIIIIIIVINMPSAYPFHA